MKEKLLPWIFEIKNLTEKPLLWYFDSKTGRNVQFLTKIQNHINKKSGKEILLLSKFLVTWQKSWIVVGFTIQNFFDSSVFTRFLSDFSGMLLLRNAYYLAQYQSTLISDNAISNTNDKNSSVRFRQVTTHFVNFRKVSKC